MCNIQEGFKLCTCGVTKKPTQQRRSFNPLDKSPRIPTSFQWTLFQRDPSPPPPRKGLANLQMLTDSDKSNIEFVEQELNQRDCFDFEYGPIEGDYLHFQQDGPPHKFFAFTFLAGKWQQITPNAFRNGLKQEKEGAIKYPNA